MYELTFKATAPEERHLQPIANGTAWGDGVILRADEQGERDIKEFDRFRAICEAFDVLWDLIHGHGLQSLAEERSFPGPTQAAEVMALVQQAQEKLKAMIRETTAAIEADGASVPAYLKLP